MATVADPSGTGTTLSYNSDGERSGIAFPNGVSEAMQYNGFGQLTQMQATNASGTVLTRYAYSYTNPSTGMPTFLRYRMQNVAGDTTAYTYDALNRLTGATQTSATGSTLASYQYPYDAAGNMLSEDLNGTTTAMTYNAANELTQAGTTTYSYDANGNLTGNSAGLTFAYNAANQAMRITSPGGSTVAMGYTGTGQTDRVTAGANGFEYITLRVDPLVLHELTYVLPRYVKTMTRSDVVLYCRSVLQWTGIHLDEAPFWLMVLETWEA